MTAREALMQTRRLLTAGWTRGTMHRVSEGKDYYCLVGALRHTTRWYDGREHHAAYREARTTLADLIGGRALTDFNDSQQSVRPVITLIDDAINKVSTKEGM